MSARDRLNLYMKISRKSKVGDILNKNKITFTTLHIVLDYEIQYTFNFWSINQPDLKEIVHIKKQISLIKQFELFMNRICKWNSY